MKDDKKIDGMILAEFNSISEFYDYVTNTPINKAFSQVQASQQSQSTFNGKWYGTYTYDEAISLMKNGWDAGAKMLTQRLKEIERSTDVQKETQNILSMCGYQAIVPLYLNGVPNNMVNKRIVATKQKVITINKITSASCGVSCEQLQNESIKCFQIIRKLESMGHRVNLNLLMSTGHVCAKIRLKSADEKLNISKLAFPLVHTSMFRRLYFRFIEVYPTIPSSFIYGYGRVPSESAFKAFAAKGEITLPTLVGIQFDGANIKNLTADELICKLNKK